ALTGHWDGRSATREARLVRVSRSSAVCGPDRLHAQVVLIAHWEHTIGMLGPPSREPSRLMNRGARDEHRLLDSVLASCGLDIHVVDNFSGGEFSSEVSIVGPRLVNKSILQIVKVRVQQLRVARAAPEL